MREVWVSQRIWYYRTLSNKKSCGTTKTFKQLQLSSLTSTVIHIRVMYVPCRQPVDKCLPIDWRPFRELIQYPRKSKPYLTYDRSEPQTKSTINRMCYSVMEEEWQNYQSHDYNSSIWCELGGWNRNNSWKWLCSICGPEKAMEISD